MLKRRAKKHFYGRVAAEDNFSDPILRTSTASATPASSRSAPAAGGGGVGASVRTCTEQPGGCERDGQRCGEGRCGGRWKEELAECGARALGWERPTGLIFRLFCALLRRAAAEENFSSECSRLFTSYPTMIIRIIFWICTCIVCRNWADAAGTEGRGHQRHRSQASSAW